MPKQQIVKSESDGLETVHMGRSADKVTAVEFLMRKQGLQKGSGVRVNSPPVTAAYMC